MRGIIMALLAVTAVCGTKNGKTYTWHPVDRSWSPSKSSNASVRAPLITPIPDGQVQAPALKGYKNIHITSVVSTGTEQYSVMGKPTPTNPKHSARKPEMSHSGHNFTVSKTHSTPAVRLSPSSSVSSHTSIPITNSKFNAPVTTSQVRHTKAVTLSINGFQSEASIIPASSSIMELPENSATITDGMRFSQPSHTVVSMSISEANQPSQTFVTGMASAKTWANSLIGVTVVTIVTFLTC